MKLAEMEVRNFASVLASDAPAPGGGSVAGLEGALGAALTSMVTALTVGKKRCRRPPMKRRQPVPQRSRKA